MSYNSKQLREYNTFYEFAKVCTYYEIDLNSIKVNNNPDILCKLNDGSEKGFELTGIIDEKYQQIRKIRIKLEKILQNFLLVDDKFLKHFSNKRVAIYFPRSVKSHRDLNKNLVPLRDYLIDLSLKGITEDNPREKFSFVDYITIRESEFSPNVRVPDAQSIGIPVEKRLDDKFNKHYLKKCNLLMYYDKLTVFDRAFSYDTTKVYLEKNKDRNPYEKIWIFTLKDKTILFEYP